MTDRIKTLLDAKDYAGALHLLEQIPEEARDVRWHFLRYRAEEGLEWYYEALTSLKTACERDPGNPIYQKEWKRKSGRYSRQNADPSKKKKMKDNCQACLYCSCECSECCCESTPCC